MDELKNKGVDVGRALDASISNAINTATNQQELDALKLKIEDLRGVLGSKVADGLLQQAGQQLIVFLLTSLRQYERLQYYPSVSADCCNSLLTVSFTRLLSRYSLTAPVMA